MQLEPLSPAASSVLTALPSTVRRGITPVLLLSQIENTVPFLFADAFGEDSAQPHVSFLRSLRRGDSEVADHLEYFRLCLAAHHATVGSFVPTDVDNAIRSKLWDRSLPTETLLQMSDLVTQSYHWSGRGLSARLIEHGQGGPALSGLLGEWYSTAAAAYGALRKREPKEAAEILQRIQAEVEREEYLFAQFEQRGEGIGLLQASTVLSHNLGDLDRVIDLWELPETDTLRLALYKRGHGSEGPSARAGAWNKAYMAAENHRHLTLRGPRCLRTHWEWLLPIGPFFDDWGMKIAKGLSPEGVGKVAEALVDGWHKIPHTTGYARALAGILEAIPGGATALRRNVPSRIYRSMESGRLRSLISVPRLRFEASWSRLKI